MSYFTTTYEQSRASFLEKASQIKEKFPGALQEQILVPHKNEEPLYTDILFIPPDASADTLIIITSGVHGIEGYTGSAIQQMWIDRFFLNGSTTGAAFLFVHSVNPFGQKYYRRVSQNNVDLNRNFDVSNELFLQRNHPYASFHPVLNPQGPYRRKSGEKTRFLLKTLKLLRQKNIKTFRQAVLQGQYEFEKGIFFGGKQFEPQKEIINQLVCRFAQNYRRIILIDLHTGYGYRGRLHLIGMDRYPDPAVLEQLQKLYPTEKIEEADKDSGDFYKISGSMFDFIYKICTAENKTVLPMAWEFGTFDNIKTRKSIGSLRIMINENRGYHYGYANDKSRQKALKEFRNLYYPDDKTWQQNVLDKSHEVFRVLLKQTAHLEADIPRK